MKDLKADGSLQFERLNEWKGDKHRGMQTGIFME